jgi:hypothetical protein
LFDKVRLWTSADGASGDVVPVALRWPVGLYFAAPLAGVEHQLLQLGEMSQTHIMIFRSFSPLGAGVKGSSLQAAVLPPFPDAKTCDYSPVQRSRLRCSPSAIASVDQRQTPIPRPAERTTKRTVVTFVLAHSPDMLVPGARAGLGATLRLDNVNVADVMGEALFISLFATQPGLTNVTLKPVHSDLHLMSAVEVEVDTQWGIYQGCNYGVCEREFWKLPYTVVDPAFPAIGRLTIGKFDAAVNDQEVYDAQCGATKIFGSWFSLPAVGRCAENASVGEDACTWKQLRVVKTVDTRSCFLQNEALMNALRNWRTFAVPTCSVAKYCTPPKAMARAISAALMASDQESAPGCLPL